MSIKKIILLSLSSLFVIPAFSQNTIEELYELAIKKGNTALANGNFGLAVNSFLAARGGNQDLADKADKGIRTAFARIEALKRSEEVAKQEALIAKDSIEQQNTKILSLNNSLQITLDSLEITISKEIQARKEANIQAVRAEARLHASQANQFLAQKKDSLALAYAFEGFLQAKEVELGDTILEKRDTILSAYEAFGNAVYANKKNKIKTPKAGLIQTEFSPNGQFIISFGKDATAMLWDNQWQPIKALNGHKKIIHQVAFNEQADKILTCSADSTAILWNTAGQIINNLKGHKGGVLGGIFARDGQTILTWSRDGTALLWDTTGQVIDSLKGHKGSIYNAFFSPDETKIITRSSDQTVRLWDLKRKKIAKLDQHKSYIYNVIFSPKGDYIITCSADKTAILWDKNGQKLATLDHPCIVKSATFAKDAPIFLTLGTDKMLRVWDLNNLKKPYKILKHKYKIQSAAFSNNGQHILSCEQGKQVLIWEVATGQSTYFAARHQQGLRSAQFSPNEAYIITSSLDGTAKLWDKSGILLMSLDHTGRSNPQFTYDERHLITSPDGLSIEITPLPYHVFQQMQEKGE